MFLKRRGPKTDKFEEEKYQGVKENTEIKKYIYFFASYNRRLHKSVSQHILALQNIPNISNYFHQKNLHFCFISQRTRVPPPSTKNVSFFWTAPLTSSLPHFPHQCRNVYLLNKIYLIILYFSKEALCIYSFFLHLKHTKYNEKYRQD